MRVVITQPTTRRLVLAGTRLAWAMSETPTAPLTVDTALANAARLLHAAELETNHSTMERYEKLADSWVNIAGLIAQRERV